MFACAAGAQETSKVDIFLGYQYVRFFSQNNGPAFNGHGGDGQVAYNFNRWLAGVIDLGGIHSNGFGGLPIDSTTANFMAGPRVTFRKWERFAPFAEAVFGGAWNTSSIAVPLIAATAPPLPAQFGGGLFANPGTIVTGRLRASQTAFAMAAGLGIEFKLTRRLRFRPVEAQYYMTRFENFRTIGESHQNNLRAMAGFTFALGGEKPAAPPPPARTKTCWNGSVVPANAACPKHDITLSLNASPAELCPGNTAQLTPVIQGATDKNNLKYVWTVNGKPVSESPTFVFATDGLQPGTYSVALHVSGPDYNAANAGANITVREYRPPTGTVQANPAQLYVGEKATLTASFHGQCGDPISDPVFTASEGTIQGNTFDSSTVTFDPTNKAEQRKSVTITAKVTDARGTEGTASTNVDVINKATISAIRLPDVLFPRDSSRVNNCGKRVLLEELRSYIQRDPTGTVVLVGHSSSDEKISGLDMQRALNAAAVITAGSGVCLSIPKNQVQISATGADQNGVPLEPGFCGPSVSAGSSSAANMRRVEVWFVPTGGAPPASLKEHQDATALPVSELGCPK
jgi:outer membrane protein OmpA-like peptidoglycan-associated protein